jgi:hypothetical protein
MPRRKRNSILHSRTTQARMKSSQDASIAGDLFGRHYPQDGGRVRLCRRHEVRPRGIAIASADKMAILSPVHSGGVVTFSGKVNAVWNISMEVRVRVETENPWTDEFRHPDSSYLTLVALDKHWKPNPITKLHLESEENHLRSRWATRKRA